MAFNTVPNPSTVRGRRRPRGPFPGLMVLVGAVTLCATAVPAGAASAGVALANPTIVTAAMGTVTVPNSILDTSILSGGSNPTGTVTFSAFGPNNASCTGSAAFTSTAVVHGNGSYWSDNFIATQAGTYQYVAIYSGDSNNNSATSPCGAPNESEVVAQATTQLMTFASSGSMAGSGIGDTVFLHGFNPTGIITVTLFGPNNATCAGTPVFTTTISVTGNGNYFSSPYTTTAAGTYNFVGAYSGDANNTAATGACGAANETATVGKASPGLQTSASFPIVLGGAISDTGFLSGGVSPAGTITFTLFGPKNGTCAGPPIFTSTKAVSGNGGYASDPFTPTAAGGYTFIASYSGDANNNAVGPAACNSQNETVFVSARPVSGDFDADGTSDLAVFRPSTGTWYVSNSSGFPTTTWGASGDIPVDFNNFGQNNVMVFRPSTGIWYNGNVCGSGNTQWGASGDVPVPGDYNGDGRPDIAVFRPSTGTWYINYDFGNPTVATWGASGDIPVPGDYNGDGKTDTAVFRPSTGTWYINDSAGHTSSVNWGSPGDIPVPGDYNGDGKTDIAVFRPSTGAWYIQLSGGSSIMTVSWGISTDVPVVGDFNGDGKADLGVFRPSTGTWYINLTGGGTIVNNWGASGDIPIEQPVGLSVVGGAGGVSANGVSSPPPKRSAAC